MSRSHLSRNRVSFLLGVLALLGLTAPAAHAGLLGVENTLDNAVDKVDDSVDYTVDKVDDTADGTVDKVECTVDNAVPCVPGVEVPETPCWPDVEPPCSLCPSHLPCQKLTSTKTETTVPLCGTANLNPCVPGGTYVKGYLNVRTSFITSTCGTRMRTETSTCNAKIVTPYGVFTANEVTFDESKVGPTGTETTSYISFRYRNVYCKESYRLDLKVRTVVKIDPCDPTKTSIVHHCESAYVDCYVPCCGDVG